MSLLMYHDCTESALFMYAINLTQEKKVKYLNCQYENGNDKPLSERAISVLKINPYIVFKVVEVKTWYLNYKTNHFHYCSPFLIGGKQAKYVGQMRTLYLENSEYIMNSILGFLSHFISCICVHLISDANNLKFLLYIIYC